MKLKHIKHIFFDLDHTLWDFDKNSALTFYKILEIHNVNIDVEEFLKVYEPINFNYWKLYREERVDKASLRYGRLKDSFTAINYKVEDDLIHQLSEDYIIYLTSFNHLFDGTIELLNYLKPNYQLHIITNGFEEAQHKKMEASKIAHYFKTITNSEQAGVKKPNPIIFNYALDMATANPNESIMIGDNLEADIQGALDVGLDAIFFNYQQNEVSVKVKFVNELLHLKRFF